MGAWVIEQSGYSGSRLAEREAVVRVFRIKWGEIRGKNARAMRGFILNFGQRLQLQRV
jgi:hypothetical protein